jgi:RyR domain
MAVKAMDGWRWAESRDDKRKRHHLLVPFDDLSGHEIAKDLEPIKKALGLS